MLGKRQERMLRLALRCYPATWRARHGDEARELAALLAQDGVQPRSTAWSYFKGASAERLLRTRGRRLRAGAAALVTGISLTAMSLLVSVLPSPAGAASVVHAGITNRSEAASELQAVFKAHRFDIAVEQLAVSPSLVGSILGTKTAGRSTTGSDGILGRVTGTCAGGASGCTHGLLLPSHFSGHLVVVVGRAAKPGENYEKSADIFRPGELLAGSGLLGRTVDAALPVVDRLHVAVVWEVGGEKNSSATSPDGWYEVTGGFAISSVSICLKVAPSAYGTMGWRG
jgi:hypothetical protein